MNTDEMRKGFEEWFNSTAGIFFGNLECDERGVYKYKFIQDMWYAWQCASVKSTHEIDALLARVKELESVTKEVTGGLTLMESTVRLLVATHVDFDGYRTYRDMRSRIINDGWEFVDNTKEDKFSTSRFLKHVLPKSPTAAGS